MFIHLRKFRKNLTIKIKTKNPYKLSIRECIKGNTTQMISTNNYAIF